MTTTTGPDWRARLYQWLRPPPAAPGSDAVRAEAFHRVAWSTIIVAAVFLTLLILLQPETAGRRMISVLSVTGATLAFLEMNRRGHTVLASWGMILALIAIVAERAYTSGGIGAPSTTAFMIFVMMSGLLLGTGAGVIIAVLILLIQLLMVVAQVTGRLPASQLEYSPYAIWLYNGMWAGLALVLQQQVAGTLRSALRRAEESERTLQKIFETAPTPIIMVRPPLGEIERANAAAFTMLGVSPVAAIGKTAVEVGIVPDAPARATMYTTLAAGQRVTGQEISILRGGWERRDVSVNADRVALASGDRFIFSFYDLTDLRRAEEELRASSEQMRQLYVRLANVEDDERRALHAELHDQVGANLAALRLQLDIAIKLVSCSDTAAAQTHMCSAREVAIETMAMARNLMGELRPPALDDYGLAAALRALAESQSARLNLPIHVSDADLAPRPSHLVEAALFRIANEAVINAARHASPSCITIDVEERDGRVILTVEDDGIGFDPDAQTVGPDHWGLKNMRERAQAIGASLQFKPGPGAGTTVTVDAPREAS